MTRGAASAIAAVFYRDLRQRMTNVGFVFWDLLAPLAYLALFGLGFERMMGGALLIDGRPLDYSAFLLPGVLAMVSFSVAMNTSWGFFMDKDSGIFHELLTYPITRTQLIVGKIAFNVVLSLLGAALVVALGAAALGVPVEPRTVPLAALVVAASTAAWFFVFSAFAIAVRRMDSFNAVTSAAYVLLMFFSSMFYPLGGMPDWFRWIASANPMTWQVDLLRWSVLGLGAPARLLGEAAALALFTAAGLGFAVRALDRAGD
ncbi:MAG TPA: ABC transporter permease [Burkholderiales bacterium]|nr:ABC transporter permease [Burkholderiales bacterium]